MRWLLDNVPIELSTDEFNRDWSPYLAKVEYKKSLVKEYLCDYSIGKASDQLVGLYRLGDYYYLRIYKRSKSVETLVKVPHRLAKGRF